MRPTLVLIGYALYLVMCGLSPLFVIDFDIDQHFHGIRLAAVIGLCGILASRYKKSPTLSVLAIDSAALIILGTGINYARLATKWYGLKGIDWYSPYQVGVMAIGGFIALWILMLTRPKGTEHGGEWWRPSPLITIPSLMLVPFTRRRHGLGFSRRIGLALGALLLMAGFVFSMSHRFPQLSIAQIVKLGQIAQSNDDLVRIAIAEPDLVAKLLKDPDNARNILNDPRAKELIEELSAEGGMLEGVDTQAMTESIANGNFKDLSEILKDSDISGAEELLALAAEGDSPIGELLGEEGSEAAKALSARLAKGDTSLEKALSEDDGAAARKLMSSMTNSKGNDSSKPDMAELMQRITEQVDPEMLRKLQGVGHIDINDSRVQAALREMNINPQDAAKLLAQSAASNSDVANLINKSGSYSLDPQRTNTIVNTNMPGSLISNSRINSRVSAERDKSELTIKQPRLFFTAVASAPEESPLEPIYIQDAVKPQQDILTRRLNKTEQPPEDATELETDVNNNVGELAEISPPNIEAELKQPVQEHSGSRKQQTNQVIDSKQITTVAIGRIAQQLSFPLDNPRSVIGLLCIIIGLVAVSASLSRR